MNMLLLILTLACAARAADTAPRKVPAKPEGKAVYSANCASCHGKDAKGSPGMAKVFGRAALDLLDEATLAKPDKDLAALTLQGSGKMPAYKAKLSPEQVDAVLAYLRSLK